ncbi:uncharacterized protein C7orf50 homolog isoform X3 [Myotis lucifugus]|nr:uncharacterized protein C7orf50 homolog isoform X3 [Myotis lucifugus]
MLQIEEAFETAAPWAAQSARQAAEAFALRHNSCVPALGLWVTSQTCDGDPLETTKQPFLVLGSREERAESASSEAELSPEEKRVLERKLKKERKKEERKRLREAAAAAPAPGQPLPAKPSGAQLALDYLCG